MTDAARARVVVEGRGTGVSTSWSTRPAGDTSAETADAELRALMELRFHGPVALTRAVRPHVRERHGGATVQISSLGGRISVPGMSAYSAGRFALEGLSIAPAQEVAPLGDKVLIALPGAMRTNFAGASISESARVPGYDETVGDLRAHVAVVTGRQHGDPAKIAAAILVAPGTPPRPSAATPSTASRPRPSGSATSAAATDFDEQ